MLLIVRILATFALILLVDSEAHSQQLFWTENGKIKKANFDGSNSQSLLDHGGVIAPWGLHVDSVQGKVYWCDWQALGIRRANLDGSDFETVAGGNTFPIGVALDSASQWLYWTDMLARKVWRRNLDSGTVETIYTSPTASPAGIVVDSGSERVCWGDMSGRITCSNLDGSNAAPILLGAFQPWALAIDSTTHQIYWTNTQNGTINRVDMNGSNVQLTIPDPTRIPWFITLDQTAGRLYWSDKGTGELYSANLDGADLQIVTGLPYVVSGLAVDSIGEQVYWSEGGLEGSIHRAQFDGSVEETVIFSDHTSACGLALDVHHSKIYWANCGFDTIQGFDLNGAHLESVLQLEYGPGKLSIDQEALKMYWLETYTYDDKAIRSANLDGSEVMTVISNDNRINDFAVDQEAGKIYWIETLYPPAVFRANTDGTSVELLFYTSNALDVALDIPHGKIYWANDTSATVRRIHRVNLDGTNDQIIRSGNQFYFREMQVNQKLQRLFWVEVYGSTSRKVQSADLDGGNLVTLLTLNGETSIGSIAILADAIIVNSEPPSCSIDPRQPFDPMHPDSRLGWNSIDLRFTAALQSINTSDFAVTEIGSDEVPPSIAMAELIGDDTVRLTLNSPIDPSAWTCFQHVNSGSQTCIGYLPGDVGSDRMSNSVDVLRLIDNLNGTASPPLPGWQTDIDRSGNSDSADVLRLVDLLNGAGAFDVWNGRSLVACP